MEVNEKSEPPDQNQELKAGVQSQPPQPVGQNSLSTTSGMPSGPTEPMPTRKPSKWRYFFIVLGVLQALGVVLFFLVITWAIRQAKAGVSGTEFIGLIIYATLVPGVGLVALINLIGLPIYMVKRKPKGKGRLFSVLSLLISLGLFLYGANSVYQLRVAVPKQEKAISDQLQQQSEAQDRQYQAQNANPEITEADAIQLLQTCKLKGFYYTNQTSKDDGDWGELSTTGVVLTKVDGQPYRISIADRLVPELVPIARQAQKNCGGDPQFWHDGAYE